MVTGLSIEMDLSTVTDNSRGLGEGSCRLVKVADDAAAVLTGVPTCPSRLKKTQNTTASLSRIVYFSSVAVPANLASFLSDP
jgi:hypothetical protein